MPLVLCVFDLKSNYVINQSGVSMYKLFIILVLGLLQAPVWASIEQKECDSLNKSGTAIKCDNDCFKIKWTSNEFLPKQEFI